MTASSTNSSLNITTAIPEYTSNSIAAGLATTFVLVVIFLCILVLALILLKYLRKKNINLWRTNIGNNRTSNNESCEDSCSNSNHARDVAENICGQEGFSDHEYDCIKIESRCEIEYCEVEYMSCDFISNSNENVKEEEVDQELNYCEDACASICSANLGSLTILSATDLESNLKGKKEDVGLHYVQTEIINTSAASAISETSNTCNNTQGRSGRESRLSCQYAIINKIKKEETRNLSCEILYDILNEHMTPVIPTKSDELLNELDKRSN